jgi:DNA repair protein RadC
MPTHALQALCLLRRPPGGARMRLACAADVAAVFAQVLAAEPVEVFGVVCVTAKHEAIGYHEVGRGTLDSVHVHPRDVFKVALYANAAAVFVGHNHPSGDVAPSDEDRKVTERLAAAGRIVGIEVLDHVVVADGAYFSFRERGLLRPPCVAEAAAGTTGDARQTRGG